MIISHRGNDIYGYNENTKEAILSSLKSKYVDGVEFDIRLTRDNYMVLNHGVTYDNKIIKYTKYKDLKLLKLNDLLKSVNNKKILLIEIKDDEEKVINIVYKIIKKYKNLNIWIHTFNYNIAKKFKSEYPNYKVGLIVGNIININKDIEIFDFISLYYKTNKKFNKMVILWTVNDKKKLEKYYLENYNVITDKPFFIIT